MLDLYKNIRRRREELGMSQEELAIALGYKSRSSINKIEKGINDIPQSKIVEFAKVLKTTPEILMGWETTPDDAYNLLDSTLSSAEQAHIEKYRAISDTSREAIDNQLDFFYKKDVVDTHEETRPKEEDASFKSEMEKSVDKIMSIYWRPDDLVLDKEKVFESINNAFRKKTVSLKESETNNQSSDEKEKLMKVFLEAYARMQAGKMYNR